MARRDGSTRWRAAIVTALCVPLGLGTKRIPADWVGAWIADHLGGSVYVVFWCFAVFTLLPRARRSTVIVAVVLATCAIELLQLSDAGWLVAIRANRAGALLLGSTFSWTDFPFYVGGGAMAWWLTRAIRRSSEEP